MSTDDFPSPDTSKAPSSRKPKRSHKGEGKLETGHTRLALIRELASQTKTRTVLSKEYGCSTPAISQFAQRHAAEIEAVRQDTENQLAGLWIANKAARVSEYQADVDDINAAPVKLPDDRRIKHSALKAVAEELGQIPNRVTLDHTGSIDYRHELIGVDTDEL